MSARVVVVGDVMTDIIVVPEGEVVRGSDRRARIEQHPGGGGANQAVWLAAMGVEAHLVARVGAADAARLTAYFEGQGVIAHLGADSLKGTGTLICLIDPDGERSFLTDRGANLNLCSEDLPDTLLDSADLLHISGYALFESTPRTAVMTLIQKARKRGIPVSVDPASTAFLKEVGATNFLTWVEGADFIFPNVEEAALLTGESTPDKQIAALLPRFGSVALKRGVHGAAFANRRSEEVLFKLAPETNAIDTTGAGDAFLGGFMASFLAGKDPETCLENAILAGSRAVQHTGAQPSST